MSKKQLPAPPTNPDNITLPPYRIFSSGWGLQSVAVLVLQATNQLPRDYDEFVFANVGEDSENPATLDYYRDIVKPYAAAHSINLTEVQKTRKGELDTVYQAALRDNRSLPIPVVFPGKGYGNRTCTSSFKIEVVHKHAKSLKRPRIVMGIGFSTDEKHRLLKRYPEWHDHIMTRNADRTWKEGERLGFSQLYEFPLIGLGLSRLQCAGVIERAGLPLPPKSACWFCPFTGRSVWIDRKRNDRPLFDKAVQFEKDINEKYKRIRANHPKASPFVGLHVSGKPLDTVPDQMSLWDEYQDKDSSCDDVCGL